MTQDQIKAQRAMNYITTSQMEVATMHPEHHTGMQYFWRLIGEAVCEFATGRPRWAAISLRGAWRILRLEMKKR